MAARIGMNVGQLCTILERVAKMHEKLGSRDSAEGLRALSKTLKVKEELAVSKLVGDVKKLRTSDGKKVRRRHESA